MEPSNGSVRERGSTTVPGIWLGVASNPTQGRTDREQVVVVGGERGQATGRRIAGLDRAESTVAYDAVVGICQPRSFIADRKSVCTRAARRSLAEENGRRIAEGDAAGVGRDPPGVHVDTDQSVGVGQIGAEVPGDFVVMGASDGQHPLVDIRGESNDGAFDTTQDACQMDRSPTATGEVVIHPRARSRAARPSDVSHAVGGPLSRHLVTRSSGHSS